MGQVTLSRASAQFFPVRTALPPCGGGVHTPTTHPTNEVLICD